MNGGNPAVPDNDEISPGVSWRLTRTARSPLDPSAIAQFLGPGNRLISKVRVSRPDRARDAIDLVAATVDAPGLVEHAIFGEDCGSARSTCCRTWLASSRLLAARSSEPPAATFSRC